MSGLIIAGMGQGLANAGQTTGQWMMRGIERDLEMDRRSREREEDRQLRRELQEDAQRETRERDALYRKAVGAQGSGGGGGASGYAEPDIGQGGAAEGRIAGEMGLTVPELRALRGFRDKGSTEGMPKVEREVTTEPFAGEYSDQVSRANREKQIVSELPPGFEAEARAKIKALSRLENAYRMGKDNKNFQDGESERFRRENAEAARDGKVKPEQAGLVNAVSEGKPIYTVKGDEKLNQYTGGSETTDVGESKVRKNDRPPAPKGGGGSGGGSSKADPSTVVQRVTEDDQGNVIAIMRDGSKKDMGMKSSAFNARVANIIRDLEKADPKFARLPEAEKRGVAVGRLSGAPAPAPAPAAAPKPAAVAAPKKDYSSLWK